MVVATSTVLSKMMGKSSGVLTFEIEKGQIRRFAKAIGEVNPIHFEEEAAKAGGYSKIIAPLTFPAVLHDYDNFYADVGINPHTMMHQEEEYEYFRPIMVGDKISVVHKMVNAFDKGVPNGQLIFLVIETRANDAKERPVFKARRVLVELKK